MSKKSKEKSSISSRTWNSKSLELVNWNQDQLNIFDWVKNGQGHALVTGVAGCGKSTTIIGTLPFIEGKTQLVAFNNHIVSKLKEDTRITKTKVSISTAHSLGFSLLKANLSRLNIEIDNYKLNRLLNDIIKEKGLEEKIKDYLEFKYSYTTRYDPNIKNLIINSSYLKVLDKLIELVRKMQCNLEDINEYKCLYTIMYYNIYFPLEASFFLEYLLDIPQLLLNRSFEISTKYGKIDFSDMLWLPYKLGFTNVSKKEFIIVDEAQDVNKAMIHLYNLFTNQGARAIFFGDPAQSIFGFNGSSLSSWNLLKETFNPDELQLSYCYRCPTSHIGLAQRFVDITIQSPLNTLKGNLVNKTEIELLKDCKPGDIILSRYNYPLMEICLKLALENKRAYIVGKDIGKSILSLLNELKKDSLNYLNDSKTTYLKNKEELNQVLIIKEIALSYIDNGINESDIYIDKLRLIIFVIDFLHKRKPNTSINFIEIESLISKIFEASPNSIMLSTIHRAKGLEANNVWILKPNELPSSYKVKQNWQRKQEENLVYVALTRAISNLYFVVTNKIILSQPYGGLKLPNE